MRKKERATKVFIRNFTSVIQFSKENGRKVSNREISKKQNISDRMIGKIKNGDSSPTIDKVESIAQFFDLPAWILLLPYNVPPSLVMSNEIIKLVVNYISADSSRRKKIQYVAECASNQGNNLTLRAMESAAMWRILQPESNN